MAQRFLECHCMTQKYKHLGIELVSINGLLLKITRLKTYAWYAKGQNLISSKRISFFSLYVRALCKILITFPWWKLKFWTKRWVFKNIWFFIRVHIFNQSWSTFYPFDGDLSTGWSYPLFERPETGVFLLVPISLLLAVIFWHYYVNPPKAFYNAHRSGWYLGCHYNK